VRIHIDYRTASKETYQKFCKKHPTIKLNFDEWRNILYGFNDGFKTYILETGDKARLPAGFGEFSINKKKRRKTVEYNGTMYVNLPVDWQKSKEKGKKIYNFNHHTEGFFFGWIWFKESARLRNLELWWFKPTRLTSRLINHYIKTDNKYQHLYNQWKN